ncbi:hypothetical protein GPECTOR_2g1414 [Gonium pectorale]|uniref:Uncharacterized protein n=1 Tax=Gonium pectorale TaxID=33097 RepID=A0A150H1H8_GONPE|nr:hypothetical protein GPECTOR_2g1414 [Gonium pectorale]|eukprot:KXZ55863.1 hypothetical protein GPECTOR_2g1414 [Gonium pectorale]
MHWRHAIQRILAAKNERYLSRRDVLKAIAASKFKPHMAAWNLWVEGRASSQEILESQMQDLEDDDDPWDDDEGQGDGEDVQGAILDRTDALTELVRGGMQQQSAVLQQQTVVLAALMSRVEELSAEVAMLRQTGAAAADGGFGAAGYEPPTVVRPAPAPGPLQPPAPSVSPFGVHVGAAPASARARYVSGEGRSGADSEAGTRQASTASPDLPRLGSAFATGLVDPEADEGEGEGQESQDSVARAAAATAATAAAAAAAARLHALPEPASMAGGGNHRLVPLPLWQRSPGHGVLPPQLPLGGVGAGSAAPLPLTPRVVLFPSAAAAAGGGGRTRSAGGGAGGRVAVDSHDEDSPGEDSGLGDDAYGEDGIVEDDGDAGDWDGPPGAVRAHSHAHSLAAGEPSAAGLYRGSSAAASSAAAATRRISAASVAAIPTFSGAAGPPLRAGADGGDRAAPVPRPPPPLERPSGSTASPDRYDSLESDPSGLQPQLQQQTVISLHGGMGAVAAGGPSLAAAGPYLPEGSSGLLAEALAEAEAALASRSGSPDGHEPAPAPRALHNQDYD